MYLIINKANGYIQEKNENKYLVVALTDKSKVVMAKYREFCNKIKYLIKTINDGKEGEYEKDFMKIRFESDNNFPSGKILRLHNLAVVVTSVFKGDGKYKCLHEFQICYNMKELMFKKESTLINQSNQKSVCFVIIGILKTFVISLKHTFVMFFIIY